MRSARSHVPLWLTLLPVTILVSGAVTSAHAFPGFFAGKKAAKRINHATQIVVMMREPQTVVSVMADYDGPLDEVAMVLPVPADVTLDHVKTGKSEIVDHLDQVSAPKFWEFWEKDPCDDEPQIQEWERDLRVSGAGFLGDGAPLAEAKRSVPKEMRVKVEPTFKEGVHSEYTYQLVGPGEPLATALGQAGYQMPEGAEQAIKPYAEQGLQFLIVEVDTRRVGLGGGDRALLSPVRFATRQPFKIASTLGLLSAAPKQELIVYTVHPKQRFEVAGYENLFPPTNIHVDFKVKERIGEFYAGVHDLMLEKHPQAFLVEYAWAADGCGQPCANEGMLLSELLTLGGDFFELDVPEPERLPEPPALTEEEEERDKVYLEAIEDKKERKEEAKRLEEDRVELARRKALIERQKYVVTRLHHRYDAAGLPKDIEFKAAAHVKGGAGIPEGEQGELPKGAQLGGDESMWQIRYTHLHPNRKVVECAQPKPHRWGIPPISYRGLRKIWVAQAMSEKNRTQLKPAEVVLVDVADLGLTGQWTREAEAKKAEAEALAKAAADSQRCGCRVGAENGAHASKAWCWLVALGLGVARVRRRTARLNPAR